MTSPHESTGIYAAGPSPEQQRITDLEAKNAALKADLADAQERGSRYFDALQRALPGHFTAVLWSHYTTDRWAIARKFREWVDSEKNTVGPFDPEHWFRVFGLQEGDWIAKPADPAPVADAGMEGE